MLITHAINSVLHLQPYTIIEELNIIVIRLDSDGNIKVGDFGLTEDVYNVGYFREERKENIKLPYKWMALESLNDHIFSEKTDVVTK